MIELMTTNNEYQQVISEQLVNNGLSQQQANAFLEKILQEIQDGKISAEAAYEKLMEVLQGLGVELSEIKDLIKNNVNYDDIAILYRTNAQSRTIEEALLRENIPYKIIGSFITPFDLKYDDRVIKKKSIDYGYALSVHKSQGSTYDTVMVDMGNIMKCLNKIELRQLQYVAMSRTRKNILLLN